MRLIGNCLENVFIIYHLINSLRTPLRPLFGVSKGTGRQKEEKYKQWKKFEKTNWHKRFQASKKFSIFNFGVSKLKFVISLSILSKLFLTTSGVFEIAYEVFYFSQRFSQHLEVSVCHLDSFLSVSFLFERGHFHVSFRRKKKYEKREKKCEQGQNLTK